MLLCNYLTDSIKESGAGGRIAGLAGRTHE